MTRSWNGLDLTDEYSTLLGDTSSGFQTKTLSWINDIVDEIALMSKAGIFRVKGKAVLTASAEQQNLYIPRPGAPTLAALAGGSLTSGTVYKVGVVYVESVSGAKSKLGTSASITPSGGNLSITLTAIPTANSSLLVTSREIYLKKGSAEWFLYSTLSDNTTTTTTITADTSDSTEAPDRDNVMVLDGSPFLESSSCLTYKPLAQLRALFQGTWSTGTPAYWSDLWQDKIVLYPAPSSALILSFYYLRWPIRVTDSLDSQLEIPQHFRSTLWKGVKWKGMAYRDREGADAAEQDFYGDLAEKISSFGSPYNQSSTVRDVNGDSDGFEVD